MSKDLINQIKKIKYGWVDSKGNVYQECGNHFLTEYYLRKPSDIIENEAGIAFDIVEVSRYLFKKNKYNIYTFALIYYGNEENPIHPFFIYEENGKYIWFEQAWQKHRGCYEFNTLEEAVNNVILKYKRVFKNYKHDYLRLYAYDKLPIGSSCMELYDIIENSYHISLPLKETKLE